MCGWIDRVRHWWAQWLALPMRLWRWLWNPAALSSFACLKSSCAGNCKSTVFLNLSSNFQVQGVSKLPPRSCVRCALNLFDLLSHDCAACYLLTRFFQIFTATREERAFEVGLCHDARGVRDLRYQCICNLCSYISFIRYTTVSQPECVDGWLGMQLSDNLWFPCWNSKVMSDSAARIIPLISFQEHTAALQPATPVPVSYTHLTLPTILRV